MLIVNKNNANWLRVFFILISSVFILYIYRNVAPVNVEFFLGMLLIASLAIIFKSKEPLSSPYLLIWVGLILSYWLSTAISSLYHLPLGERAITVLTTANLSLIFIAIAIALFRLKPSIDYFWYLMLLGATVSISLAVADATEIGWFQADFGHGRLGEKYSHPVKFAVVVSGFVVILLGALPWAYKKSGVLLTFTIIVLLVLILITALTQSRTAWLGWPEAFIGWGLYYAFLLRKKYPTIRCAKTFIFLIMFVLAFLLMQFKAFYSPFIERGNEAINNVAEYVSGKNMMTSLGMRLTGYEIALQHIPDNLWIGIGEDAFPQFIKEESKAFAQEEFNQNINGFEFSQLHNQFLMSFLTKGVFVFVTVLAFFVFLFWFFIKMTKKLDFNQKPIAIAGLIFSVSSFLAFMPETPLQNSDMSTHFFLLWSLLIVFTLLELDQPKKMQVK